MAEIFVHVGIIGWTGMADRVLALAKDVAPAAGRVSVVYSNRSAVPETGPGDWHMLPDTAFFGAKFARLLSLWDGGVLLLMHPDTGCDDWPGLVRAAGQAFGADPALGLWAPDLDGTPWRTPIVALPHAPQSHLVPVVQTDGVILGLAPAVVPRLRALDYGQNIMGWGIDWVAVAHARAAGLKVVRDTRWRVRHAEGRGYGNRAAWAQMQGFFSQLTEAEQQELALIRSYAALRRRDAKPLLSRLAAQFRGPRDL